MAHRQLYFSAYVMFIELTRSMEIYYYRLRVQVTTNKIHNMKHKNTLIRSIKRNRDERNRETNKQTNKKHINLI